MEALILWRDVMCSGTRLEARDQMTQVFLPGTLLEGTLGRSLQNPLAPFVSPQPGLAELTIIYFG